VDRRIHAVVAVVPHGRHHGEVLQPKEDAVACEHAIDRGLELTVEGVALG
jgi:hypothetical protein